jgi:hypothetical protein
MRKFCLAIVLIGSLASALFAQKDPANKNSKDFSLCGSIAYGLGVGGQWIDASVKTNGQAIIEKNDKYLNYGDGFKLELGGIYKLMENLDAQAVLSYSPGVPEIQAVNESISDNTKVTNTYQAGMFGIKVMALPRVRILDLLDMYTGFGFGLYFTSLSWTNSSTSFDGNFETSPALAFCGCIGVNYPVHNDLIIYGEIGLEQMSFTENSKVDAGSGLLTSYVQDSKASNDIPPPPKIPGTNVALRVGAKFPIF